MLLGAQSGFTCSCILCAEALQTRVSNAKQLHPTLKHRNPVQKHCAWGCSSRQQRQVGWAWIHLVRHCDSQSKQHSCALPRELHPLLRLRSLSIYCPLEWSLNLSTLKPKNKTVWIHVYVWLSHSAVRLKLSPYC